MEYFIKPCLLSKHLWKEFDNKLMLWLISRSHGYKTLPARCHQDLLTINHNCHNYFSWQNLDEERINVPSTRSSCTSKPSIDPWFMIYQLYIYCIWIKYDKLTKCNIQYLVYDVQLTFVCINYTHSLFITHTHTHIYIHQNLNVPWNFLWVIVINDKTFSFFFFFFG